MHTKTCEECKIVFKKPVHGGLKTWALRRFCSRDCYHLGMKKKLTPKVPCRICGQPTRYTLRGNNRIIKMIPCDDPICREKSRQLRNQHISEVAKQMYKSGERIASKEGWQNAPRISPEELALLPWMNTHGWVPQYKVLTGATNTLPSTFWLDFALPDRKLYVEIDGTVHRLPERQAKDARRDAMLADLGWQGLRIAARAVREDIKAVKQQIEKHVVT